MDLGDFKGSSQDDKNRGLISRNLPFPVDKSKEVTSDNLMDETQIQILHGG